MISVEDRYIGYRRYFVIIRVYRIAHAWVG